MLDHFTLIAGPCVLEDDDLNVEIGRQLAWLSSAVEIPVVFKASFDKANRSRADSPRGPGLEIGLERLRHVKEETGLPVLTDVHEVEQAAAAARVADILQIPAFLCRQTDLLRAAGETGKIVNIKKGQWMTPEDMLGAVEKARGGRGAQRNGDRAGHVLRIWRPDRRHAFVSANPHCVRGAGLLRRHPLPPAAGPRLGIQWGRPRICTAPGTGLRCGRV